MLKCGLKKTQIQSIFGEKNLWLFSLYAVCVLLIFSMQKVADDKGAKAKKGGPKGKKEDGPAQNGDTKTNEVCGGNTGGGKNNSKRKVYIQSIKCKK